MKLTLIILLFSSFSLANDRQVADLVHPNEPCDEVAFNSSNEVDELESIYTDIASYTECWRQAEEAYHSNIVGYATELCGLRDVSLGGRSVANYIRQSCDYLNERDPDSLIEAPILFALCTDSTSRDFTLPNQQEINQLVSQRVELTERVLLPCAQRICGGDPSCEMSASINPDSTECGELFRQSDEVLLERIQAAYQENSLDDLVRSYLSTPGNPFEGAPIRASGETLRRALNNASSSERERVLGQLIMLSEQYQQTCQSSVSNSQCQRGRGLSRFLGNQMRQDNRGN